MNDININEKEDLSEIKLKDEEVSIEINKRRWKNRRWMSWLSFLYLFISGLSPFLFEIKEAYIPLITNSQFLFFGIIATYIGGNVIEHIKVR